MPTGPKLPWATTTGLRRPSRIAPPTRSGSSSSRRRPTRPRTAARRLPTRGPSGWRRRDRPRQHSSRALHHLERDVAGEAVRDDDVDAWPAGRSNPRRCPRSRAGPATSSCAGWIASVPLPDSSPTESSPTAGARPVHGLHEGRPHVGELDEVLGAHLDVRAGVEQQDRPARNGSSTASAGPDAAAQPLGAGGGERRARCSRRDERLGSPLAHGAGGEDDRGVRPRAHGGTGSSPAWIASGASTTCACRRRRPAPPRPNQVALAASRRALGHGGRAAVGAVGVDRDHRAGMRALLASESSASVGAPTTPRGRRRCRSSGRRGAAAAAAWQRGQRRSPGADDLVLRAALVRARMRIAAASGPPWERQVAALAGHGAAARLSSRSAAQRGSGAARGGGRAGLVQVLAAHGAARARGIRRGRRSGSAAPARARRAPRPRGRARLEVRRAQLLAATGLVDLARVDLDG